LCCTQDSLLTAAPPLAAFIVGLAAGPSADLIITHRWLSVTATRKLFTFVGKYLSSTYNSLAFIALTLLVWHREAHLACKN